MLTCIRLKSTLDTAGRFKLLLLPNVAALSDRQCRQIRDFVETGGYKVITTLDWTMQQAAEKWALAVRSTQIKEYQAYLKSIGVTAIELLPLHETQNETNDVDPKSIQTEGFRLPATCFAEETGSFTNSSRVISWKEKAVDPPGEAKPDSEIIAKLFVKLREGLSLSPALMSSIKAKIRDNTTPRHVPAKIVQVADIPRTKSNKIVELAVRNVVHGRPVRNIETLANPEALEEYRNREELQS